MPLRFISVFLLLLTLGACGGGGSSSGDDSSGEFEVMIEKNQSWLAASCDKEKDNTTCENDIILELKYREKGSDSAFSSFNSGDVVWSPGETEEKYIELKEIPEENRFIKLVALKPCPEDNPECVVITGSLVTSKKTFSTTAKFVIKPTEDNLPPVANIDPSLITVDGIKIQGITDNTFTISGDKKIELNSSGSRDYDGETLQYYWDIPFGHNGNKTSPEIIITTPKLYIETLYDITLNITDKDGATTKETFELIVKPVIPTVDISSNTANGKSGDTIRLIGSNSKFTEGTITDHKWEQIDPQEPYIVPLIPKWDEETEGEKIPRGDIDITLPALSEADAEKGKDLKFKLTVTNNLGYSAYKEITIGIIPETANKAPIFSTENSGFEVDSSIIKNQTANEQTDVCIIAEATDPDTGMESFEFIWSAADENNEEGIFIKKTETIINNSDDNLKTRVCYQLPLQKHDSRNYTLTIRALDKAQQSSSQTLSLTVEPINTKPSIVINGDINNETVTITATATDSDGTIKELEWTETGSLTGDISPQNLNTKTATNSFTFTKPILKTGKSYGFTIKATDDEGEEYEKSYGYFIANTPLTPTEINITYNQESGASFLNWSNMEKANGYRIYKTSSDGIIDENTYTEKTEGETSHKLTNCPDDETCYYRIAGIYPSGEISEPSTTATFLHTTNEIRLVDEISRPAPEKNETQKFMSIKWKQVEGASAYKIIWQRNNGDDLPGPENLPVTGEETITSLSVDNDGFITYKHKEAFAIYRDADGKAEPNLYHYQIIPISEEGNEGRISEQADYYALAGRWKALHKYPDFRQNYMTATVTKEINGQKEDVVYIMGGEITGFVNIPVSTVFEYSTTTGDWTIKESMPKTLTNAASCANKNKLYIIGGRENAGGKPINTVFVYDTDTDSWSGDEYVLNEGIMDASCVVKDNKLFVIGGETENGISGNIYSSELDPSSGKVGIWKSEELELNIPRKQHGLLVHDYNILVVGGVSDSGLINYIQEPEVITLESGDIENILISDVDTFRKYRKPIITEREIDILGSPTTVIDIIGYEEKDGGERDISIQRLSNQFNEIFHSSAFADLPDGNVNSYAGFSYADNKVISFWHVYSPYYADTATKYSRITLNLNTSEWTKEQPKEMIGDFRDTVIYNSTTYLLGNNQFQKYGISEKEVTNLTNMNNEYPIEDHINWAYNKKIYSAKPVDATESGWQFEIYTYDTETDTWLSKVTVPVTNTDSRLVGIVKNIAEKAYFPLENGEILTYNVIKQITSIANEDDKTYLANTTDFFFMDKSYDQNNINILDITAQEWLTTADFQIERCYSGLTTINAKIIAFLVTIMLVLSQYKKLRDTITLSINGKL